MTGEEPPRPLVVITRAEEGDEPLATALEARGLACQALPAIAVVAPDDTTALDSALRDLATYDWLVFTSGHAVTAVVEHPAWPAVAGRRRGRVAAVGRATADRLTAAGLAVDLVPATYGAHALAEELLAAVDAPERCRVLWPRADIARTVLRDRLEAAGIRVDAPIAYRTVPRADAAAARELEQALAARRVAAVAFLSPSSAQGLASALGGTLRALAGACAVASVGPTTSAALRALGAAPDVEAAEHTASGLAASLHEHLRAVAGGRP